MLSGKRIPLTFVYFYTARENRLVLNWDAMFTCWRATYLGRNLNRNRKVGGAVVVGDRQTSETHKFMTKMPESRRGRCGLGALHLPPSPIPSTTTPWKTLTQTHCPVISRLHLWWKYLNLWLCVCIGICNRICVFAKADATVCVYFS